MEAVEKNACATRVGEGRTESFEGLGSGSADTAEIFELGLGEFSGFARGRVAEVKLGVVEAKRLARSAGAWHLRPLVRMWRPSMNEDIGLPSGGVYSRTLRVNILL